MDQDKPQKANNPGAEKEVADFKADERKANEAWDHEKDVVSGVDKKIEEQLEKGNLKPGDIQNLGD